MRFSIPLLAALFASVAAATSVREAADQLLFNTGNPDDVCPDAKVRCFKDNDLTQPVGSLGKKSFCRDEETGGCKQCHSKLNSAECNTKYLKDCATKVCASDIVLVLVAVLFPPASVAFLTGCSCDLLINFCLTLLGYLPGHAHAFWIIYKSMRAEEQFGAGNYQYLGNGEYVPVAVSGSFPHQQEGGYYPQQQQQQRYGATGQ